MNVMRRGDTVTIVTEASGEKISMDKGIDYDVWGPRVLTVLRIVVGLLFLEHGTQKIFGFPTAANPGPALASLMGVQGLIEVAGGALIALGLFTRPVAFILCGDMAVAYFMSHFPTNFFPITNRGDAAILYCFVFLYLAAAGGGPWSLDASRRKS
jgi:putative oxidoreductase